MRLPVQWCLWEGKCVRGVVPTAGVLSGLRAWRQSERLLAMLRSTIWQLLVTKHHRNVLNWSTLSCEEIDRVRLVVCPINIEIPILMVRIAQIGTSYDHIVPLLSKVEGPIPTLRCLLHRGIKHTIEQVHFGQTSDLHNLIVPTCNEKHTCTYVSMYV